MTIPLVQNSGILTKCNGTLMDPRPHGFLFSSKNIHSNPGQPVCRRAFIKMLAIGSARLGRTRKRFNGLDERTIRGPGISCCLDFS